ncbi:MAG: hypothetical protein J6D54_06910, partial [Olsenella sp.]|nr:hypothetical protein [Olsenella sp.]
MTVGDGVGMTVEERGVRNMVVDACEGVGIYRDVLEVKLCDGPKPEDPKPYHLGHYLGLARDGADKVVACVDRGLLARSPEFRRSCVSGALLDFLEEADRGSFRQDEWSTAAEAREVLAAGGAGAREGLAGGETFRLVYPRGSVVTLCPACGRAGVYTDAELAFGCCDNLRARCDACGAERHVAMVSCDVLLAAGGLPAGAPRADEPRVGGLYLEADGSCV